LLVSFWFVDGQESCARQVNTEAFT
jgi:hypothetical protein